METKQELCLVINCSIFLTIRKKPEQFSSGFFVAKRLTLSCVYNYFYTMHYFFTLLLSFVVSLSYAQIQDSLVVYFETNNAIIHSQENQKIIKFLSRYKDDKHKMLIYGYTDKMGDSKANGDLALQRAKALSSEIKMVYADANIRLIEGIGEDVKASSHQPDQRGRRAVAYIISDIIVNDKQSSLSDIHVLNNTILDHKKVNTYGAIDLPNIIFHPNSIFLLQESLPALNALIKTLKDNPAIKFELQGHVCCDFGYDEISKSIGYQLSIDRAYTIYKMFMKVGIAKERMIYKGYGTTMPIYTGKNIDSMDVNRRVSIKIIN